MSSSIEYFPLPNFTFEDGTTLPHARLAYQVFNPSGAKTAVIPTCFRGRISTTLNFIGTGALQSYRVIVIALFGNGESSSPSNTAGAFPATINYRDCVRAQHLLLTQGLGVEHVDVMLGFSMGGQCTYHWLAQQPGFVRRAVVMCSAARTSRHNFQFLEGPKAALENSADYDAAASKRREAAGKLEAPKGLRGFGKAYSAWLTSVAWFEDERYRDLGFETLSDWDKAVTDVNYRDWDPEDLLVMLGMWQRGDISRLDAEQAGSLEEALKAIKVPVLLMPCQTDQYFHWSASEREASALPDARCKVIPSVWGHLAGSGSSRGDNEWMDGQIREFLQEP
ncbi:Alpha/Beta hydrolase protein [Hypoxylon fragiforme]|uniref:Alpha/Beta hydrolase protein n=1 Tax=Hypoxylon fragiforme TaxID=63214 RepID=UPI0020C73332|nr:Alpha/Beta hydrolase protein [Hypoxylon fragiforme]KAI2608600.1 Alpha/Beta hydrolase protein [Hypoxylon fragiforme]